MPSTAPIIVWFRRDLRLADNPALTAAAASGAPVIALYILGEGPDVRPMGGAARWWLDKSLAALGADLAALGAGLVLRRGDPREVLTDLIAETGASGLVWNRLYDGPSRERDGALKAHFTGAGIDSHSYNAALLNEPWEVVTGAGQPYSVFTPYWRAARQTAGQRPFVPAPARLTPCAVRPASDRLEDWGLHPTHPDWSHGFAGWTPGEKGARARLEAFIGAGLGAYGRAREAPGARGTSRLSPHLAFGEIGPRQIWSSVQVAAHAADVNGEAFLRELGWREFNHHVLFHHPDITRASFRSNFDAFPWRADPAGLEAWKRGRTGFPIIDAGMRELWATGWMHNRVRMVAASFLTKDLMIDWRVGEAWFWDTLVDADIANNAANWQWVAGSGADAAPFFRIFNPVLQGEKFDPDGGYVRAWVPELARLPNSFLHQPWRAGAQILAEAGVNLGESYPAPILDHQQARHRALDALHGLQS